MSSESMEKTEKAETQKEVVSRNVDKERFVIVILM